MFSNRTAAVVALVVPAFAWAVSFQANYVMASRACAADLGTYLHLSSLIALAVAAAGIALGARISPRGGSARLAALGISAFFTIAIVVQELANLMVPRCG